MTIRFFSPRPHRSRLARQPVQVRRERLCWTQGRVVDDWAARTSYDSRTTGDGPFLDAASVVERAGSWVTAKRGDGAVLRWRAGGAGGAHNLRGLTVLGETPNFSAALSLVLPISSGLVPADTKPKRPSPPCLALPSFSFSIAYRPEARCSVPRIGGLDRV
jgi:hypothetical protein